MESVHPLVVHFPIALLMAALLLDGLALVLRRPQFHRVALWNLSLGVLGAGAAVWTGYEAAEIAKHAFEIHQVMELHRKLGIATLVLGALVMVWRLWKRDRLGGPARALTLLLMLTMSGTLAYGAHLGGRLVYEFGAGGSFGKSQPIPIEAHEHHHTH
ncbi:MAG: DUF2231 domain-containing protein [Candidatus Omnitrophica bacterium]|nr:DUF2231 domain-containing protein [Candidatus Omnitrophota bacterium]